MAFAREVPQDRPKHVRRQELNRRDLHDNKHVRRRLLVRLVPKAQDRLIIRRHQGRLRAIILDQVLPQGALVVVVLQEVPVHQGDKSNNR